jgi:hypothetical protein
MRKLHRRWSPDVQFLDVLIRQAHPGPDAPAYDSVGMKLVDVRRYETEERIPYPVLADDLAGTVHLTYGGLTDPTYIVGADGRISFYCMWTHPPTLHRALTALMSQGGSGVVLGGIDRRPHMLHAIVDGWKGLRRGAPHSIIDMEKALPGSAVVPWLGHQLRPVLKPIALRDTPLPLAARVGLAAGGAALAWVAISSLTRDGKETVNDGR